MSGPILTTLLARVLLDSPLSNTPLSQSALRERNSCLQRLIPEFARWSSLLL